MKIAYIANFLGPEFVYKYCQGKGYSVSATLKSTAIARAFLLAGHEVTIFSPGITICNRQISAFTELIDFPEGKLKVVYPLVVSYRKCSIINALTLRWLIKNTLNYMSYDAVLYYNISLDAAMCMNLFKNTPKILEYEDNIFNKALKGKINRFEFFKKLLFSFVIKRTDAAIIVGKGMLQNGEVKTKVLIPGAIDEEVLNNINLDLKTFDRKQPAKLILAGGVHYSKGPDLLLRALEYVKHPCELYFYGSGNLGSESTSLLKNIPIRHKVIFGGFIKHDILMRIFTNEADILVNSTRNMGVEPNSEGFPFKMMEYAATGRPIVSSTIGRLDDDFNRHITFYDEEDPVRIASAINYIIDNYETCAALASELQDRVIKEFSIEGISLKLNDFMNKLDSQ